MNGKTKNVIASLCAVAALAFAGIGGYMVGQSPAQPRDISAGDRVEQQDMVVGTVGAISIPGFSRLSFKAGQTAQNVAFYNPEGNTCAFEISIILPSGKEIFHSGRLLPGEKLEQIEIDAALPAAIYEATTLRYSCFSLDEAERELNGADTSCILEVLPDALHRSRVHDVGQRLRSRYYRGQHNSHQNGRGPTGAGCRLQRRAIE